MLESKRLKYRRLERVDFEFFYKLYSDEAVMRYAYLDQFSSRQEAEAAFEKVMTVQKEDDTGMEYVAVLKEGNKIVGIVDYEIIIRNSYGGICEIGYFIEKEHWGKGYGTEMAGAMIKFLFDHFPIHKIIASCKALKKKTEEMMKKPEMKKEGVFKKARIKNGVWEDEIKYAVLKEEFDS